MVCICRMYAEVAHSYSTTNKMKNSLKMQSNVMAESQLGHIHFKIIRAFSASHKKPVKNF